jgi:hypothetical protein
VNPREIFNAIVMCERTGCQWQGMTVDLSKRSTLANSCGLGERKRLAVLDIAWNFDRVSARPGHERNPMAAYFAAWQDHGAKE